MKPSVLLAGILATSLALAQQTSLDFVLPNLEKNLVEIKPGIYVSKLETSNLDYRTFLNILRKTNQVELAEKCRYDSTLWVKTFPSGFSQPMQDNYHWNNAFNDYPVVNIKHSSALAYCDWLTNLYSKWDKAQFKNAIFKLPSEAEWQAVVSAEPSAANGYPWAGTGAFDENKKCLANIKFRNEENPEKPNYLKDGGFQTVNVSSCNTTENGIYNLIGNASEMLEEEGKAKGGNWDSYLEECAADKTQIFEGADPRLGMRIMMILPEK